MKKPIENGLHITEGIGGVWSLPSVADQHQCHGVVRSKRDEYFDPTGILGCTCLNEGWCAKCAAQGTEALRAAGVQIEATA